MADAQGPKLKLLVPVSFSEKSEMALDFALTHSQGANTEIYLFHVFEDTTKNFRQLDALNEELMDRMKQTMLNAIERLQKRGFTSSVEDVHRRLAHGKAAPEIFKMADGIQADMIIMGAPTTSQFRKLVTKAPCTLVLLKEKDFS